MKKMALSIAEPCHQNWDDMTPEEKGRFCGSCQKTVIDFSNMSDRQVAEFFKKPAGSVCGRFHHDQLNRPLQVPRKRIPWVKYFFQYTWPAWMLTLKSCNNSGATMGEIAIEKTAPPFKDSSSIPLVTMGTPIAEITKVDSAKKSGEIIIDEPKYKMGLVAPPENYITGDTAIIEKPSEETVIPTVEAKTPLEEVVIVGYPVVKCRQVSMGAVSAITEKELTKKDVKKLETGTNETVIKAYPNQVKAGGQLTVALEKTTLLPEGIQLVSSSGAIVRIKQNPMAKGIANSTFSIPSSIVPGTYFLRVFMEDKTSQTAKVIVVN